MKKKGFTLAELLGVIVLLSLLFLLVFPSIVKELKSGEQTISQSVEQLIFNGATNYMEKYPDIYPKEEDTTYCFTLKELVESGDLSHSLLIDQKGKELNLNQVIEIKITNQKKTYQINDECTFE